FNEKHNFEGEDLRRRQYSFGISIEDLELILHPMAEEAKEAIGSMGDDTPLAVLSDKYRPLYHFFRQNFSQVTNPPIDSLRENKVMSLKTRFGNLGNILDFDTLTKEDIYVLNSPILSNSQFDKFINFFGKNSSIVDCTFSKEESLSVAINRIQKESEIAVRQGVTQLILSDKSLSKEQLPMPMLLCVGAINTFLITKKLRGYVSINVQSGEAMDTHSFATLIGVGATTVNPYLAFDSLYQRHKKKLFGQYSFDDCVKRYINSVNSGLLKIMSKMGISVLSSYRGGCNFETVGLSRTIVNDYFPGIMSKVSGIGLTGIEKKIREIHKEAFESTDTVLPIGGIYRYRKNGETHQYQGKLIHLLQSAVGSNSYEAYKRYAEGIYNLPPINLRDLINFRKKKLGPSINLSEVEPIEKILKRFGSGSMSHGALSKEAHETLAIGMNRIKGASCSGEGGEDEKRFKIMDGGDSANSRVKQIASARFGVTINYLNNCNEIEIKIAQGAKPGEGGQLPGFKVTEEIAKLRHSTPGVTLISPPPHHDIYSIEDLAQLIYDLKQINPKARVGVKLVASSGVGTIAAGVAKAEADIILISGHNGGTGATPQTSVKYVGIPWEMGLTEANQVLTLNNLRHKVTLRTDGGIKTGRDVVIAAMMGAEEYGVATTALVAMGCIMVRQCHSNTCPVGVCTQDDKLREKFTGTPDKVVNLFTFIASEVREILAELGFKSLNDIIGRTDLLMQVNKASPNLDDLDLSPLFVQADSGNNKRYCENLSINKVPDTLDQEIWPEIEKALDNSKKIEKEYIIKNTNRAVGTRISHHLYKKYGYEKLDENFLQLNFKGSAGQSFGAFSTKGLKLILKGDANDYVGKGLSGATIAIKLSDESNLISNENTIIGNTVLYGATSGKLFAAGLAGDRFAVRNSGAISVIEGCDSNGCEYMTGGTVIILGDVGDNFAAGMTGGMAFIYDKEKEFEKKVNPESVVWQNVETDYWKKLLENLIEEHFNETGSDLSKRIIKNFDNEISNFVQVCPKEMIDKLKNPISLNSNIKEVS
ncbi:glutamate synthase large subunit, partial [Candidatus Pelagibacter sp.]|nr:glutamate synthase large subunit [Candidatus Pelagibacter sp.]